MNTQIDSALSRWLRSEHGAQFRLASAGMVMFVLGLGLVGSGFGLIVEGYTGPTDIWSDTV